MKKFLLFLFILAVLAIIIVAAVFLLTSGVTQSADRFFKTIDYLVVLDTEELDPETRNMFFR